MNTCHRQSFQTVYAFAVRLANIPEWGESIYNTTSAGRAKAEHHRLVSEVWPNVKFTELRVRKMGSPHTSTEFRRTATGRGLPDLRCGQRVELVMPQGQRALGTVVGHDDSANFEVLFDGLFDGLNDGPLAHQKLNVHPEDLRLI